MSDSSRETWSGRLVLMGICVLFLTTFFPLFLGKNFLPFERYPQYGRALAESSGQPFRADEAFARRTQALPWIQEQDFASVTLFWAQNLYTAASLREGRLPLWDPYTGCGMPTLDSGQFRPFNPFRWPFYLVPTSWMYSATLALQLVFGALGAILWLRRRGYSHAAVLVGAGFFAFNPWVLERLTLLDASAYVVFPWCLLALERARWKDWRSLALAALSFTLMGHLGHPEAALILTALALFRIREIRAANGGYGGIGGLWLSWAAVGALAAAAMAVLWIPPLKMWSHGFYYKELPIFLDMPYSWKGFFALASDCFIPPAGLALVLASLFAKKVPKTWIVGILVSLALLMPWPGIGHLLGEFLQRWAHVHPFYLKPVLWASLSFLTAHGTDSLRSRKWTTRAAAVAGGCLSLVGIFALFATLPLPSRDLTAMPFWAVVGLFGGLLGLGLVEMNRGEVLKLLGGFLALLALATPLSLNQFGWNRVDFRTNSLVEWIQAHRPSGRIASSGTSFLPVPPNMGQAYGIRCMEQVSTLFLNRYFDLYHLAGMPPTSIMFFQPQTVAFGQAGAELLLYPNGDPGLGTVPVRGGSLYSAYGVPGATGRLYLAENVGEFDPRAGIGSQILALAGENARVALVETMGQTRPAAWPKGAGIEADLIFREDSAHGVTIDCDASGEALLVLKDSWYPGWRAAVDGRETSTYRVNGCFRGVVVPSGKHTVEFAYRPGLVYLSGALSLLTTLFLLAVCLRRRRRKMA